MKATIISKAVRALALTVTALALGAASANAQTIHYSDTFSGAGGLLDTVPVQGGLGAGTLWSANNAFNDNGTIQGTNEGSAILPFNPVVNRTYTLSLDVFNPGGVDRWMALGFAQDPLISPGANNVNDRLSNETEGIAWMLIRDHNTDQLQDVQLFKGRRTTTGIADNNTNLTWGVWHTLNIVLDTTGDGSSFTADFLIDGLTVSSGAYTISSLDNPGNGATVPGTLLNQIRYVGFAYDNSSATPPGFDNFLLTSVPEPSTLALIGVGALAYAFWLRRRK